MRKITIATTLLATTFATGALANNNINFSNPYELYSGFSVGYGTNDFDLSAQFTSKVNPDWNLLGTYHSDSNFDNHDLRLGVINNQGLGYYVAYDYEAKYSNKNVRANSLEIGAHWSTPINRNLKFTPEVSLGMFEHNKMTNTAYYTQLALNMGYDTGKNIWLSVTPEYTYSFNDLKEDNGSRSSFRNWDLIADVGYKINNNQSLVYTYQYDDGDHLSLVSYRVGF